MKSLKNIIGLATSFLILSILFICTSCGNASAEKSTATEDVAMASTVLSGFRALPSGVFIEPDLRESFDTVGYVCGKFTDAANDTLYCLALGCDYYKDPEELDEYDTGYNIIDNYMLSSNSLFIPELYLKVPFLNNIQTMDLDCDGMDELVIINDGYQSVWSSCMAYSLKDGQWNLVKPVVGINTVYRTEHPSGAPLVPACKDHPGYMYINEDKFVPEDDPTEVKTVRSLVKIEYEPVNNSQTTCYSLPGGVTISFPF